MDLLAVGAFVFEPKLLETFDLAECSDWRNRSNPQDVTAHLILG